MWSALGRTAVAAEPDLYLDDTSSYGTDTGSGNLVAMQTSMETTDYASAEAYYAKLDGYMAAADAQGWLHDDTIVVFPEWIGTWLVLANEKEELYEAETLQAAMQFMVLSNIPDFATAYGRAQGKDKVRDALFRMKAELIAEMHANAFAQLAEKYGVTIVSGSLNLPEPQIIDDELVIGEGELQNVTVVFRPDGTPYPNLTRKVYPTRDEGEFVGRGTLDQSCRYSTHRPANSRC